MQNLRRHPLSMVTATMTISLTMCLGAWLAPCELCTCCRAQEKGNLLVRRVFQGLLGFWGTPQKLPPWDHTAPWELICKAAAYTQLCGLCTEQGWEARGEVWLKSTHLHPVCPSVGSTSAWRRGHLPVFCLSATEPFTTSSKSADHATVAQHMAWNKGD